MKYEIMIRILFDLLSKSVVSASYLAKKYEVTTRTVYRYIDSLSLAGVPVEPIRGQAGGYKISDHFKITTGFLTSKEYEVVLSTLTAICNEVGDKDLESAIDKLKSVKRNTGINIKAGNLVIDAGPWSGTTGYKEKLSALSDATDDSVLVNIIYHDRSGDISERVIEPHTIAFKEGMWYVYAYCSKREDFRFFKVSRIAGFAVTDIHFNRREVQALPFDGWYENSSNITVEFSISPSVVSDVEEWLGVENVISSGDGFYAKVSIPDDGGLISKITSFGKGIKVVSPQSLIDRIKENVAQIIDNYN